MRISRDYEEKKVEKEIGKESSVNKNSKKKLVPTTSAIQKHMSPNSKV